ncbi:MAG: class I SAM-dependent methyltransferase [Marinoscillum sp.]
MKDVILIVYTTRYRKGGDKFELVARTLRSEKENESIQIICNPIESKNALKEAFEKIAHSNLEIIEFHFIGHSGMYGPMFGEVAYPEQFSPHELSLLKIPFSKSARAFFHCCRSARWFAPYFANAQNVTTYGYHWYTTFSIRKDRYKRVNPWSTTSNLYCFGSPGRKSHGILASMKKLAGKMDPETFKEFRAGVRPDRSYEKVAELYARTFSDIKVRTDEYNFIVNSLPEFTGKVLDIGCGNGALLKSLTPFIQEGVGVDVSENLLNHAKSLNFNNSKLSFKQLQGPTLPFENDSFDVVISLLSFRYLDWDPIMAEIERVLKKEGRLIIVDMVTAPVRTSELLGLLRSKVKHYYNRYRYPQFYRNLHDLVSHPDWKNMLDHNPIRSEHEMKWYLESRFPGRKVRVINIGKHSRILAFNSINMANIKRINLTYP